MFDSTKHHRHGWERAQRRARLIERLKIAAGLIIILTCLGLAGQSDYEDAVAMEQAYPAH